MESSLQGISSNLLLWKRNDSSVERLGTAFMGKYLVVMFGETKLEVMYDTVC